MSGLRLSGMGFVKYLGGKFERVYILEGKEKRNLGKKHFFGGGRLKLGGGGSRYGEQQFLRGVSKVYVFSEVS